MNASKPRRVRDGADKVQRKRPTNFPTTTAPRKAPKSDDLHTVLLLANKTNRIRKPDATTPLYIHIYDIVDHPITERKREIPNC